MHALHNVLIDCGCNFYGSFSHEHKHLITHTHTHALHCTVHTHAHICTLEIEQCGQLMRSFDQHRKNCISNHIISCAHMFTDSFSAASYWFSTILWTTVKVVVVVVVCFTQRNMHKIPFCSHLTKAFMMIYWLRCDMHTAAICMFSLHCTDTHTWNDFSCSNVPCRWN